MEKYKIETFPIPRLTDIEQVPFIELVNEILSSKGKNHDTSRLKLTLDKMIYKLFNFSDEEVERIEGHINSV